MRLGCRPAVMQAFISSIGDPSDVTSPLKSLIATTLSSFGAWFQVPCEIMPEAPSPRRCCTEREDQVMLSRTGLSSKEGVQGFPANDRKDSSGREKSQDGIDVSLFAESLRSPSLRQCDISIGRDVSWLPASMHF